MAEQQKYKALIVDDESLARANIEYSLMEFSDWSICGQCSRGDQVLDSVKQQDPDVVFLDIKMPGLDGLSVCEQLQQLNKPPLIVFVTAFDVHAVDAFELCALDYLLKPFDDERFAKTIDRVEKLLINNHDQQEQVNQLKQVSAQPNEKLETLIVRSVGRIQLIAIEKINWLSTAGNYVELHLDDQIILHRVSLSYLEKHLTTEDFFRIHRTAMIRISQVNEFLTLADGQYAVVLKTGEQVSVSQSYKERLLCRLGIE
ncbi:LytR/AlgR family response regulator transcription factor [Aliikangiella coralliicola]|uniref:Response regulator transcription factor n=1 Tax=Aliikangiella coralliicola TaxID=2592383 RepID=A0A545UGM7_9GAMM|nr:response regulator transcription factor [Aliikangiella coralliicola]TQV88617.1 response regulator transcription factor [Aliikangiella coralliicola]